MSELAEILERARRRPVRSLGEEPGGRWDGERSGIETLYGPAVVGSQVEKPIVQPMGLVVPDLHPIRYDTKAAPKRGARHTLAGKTGLDLEIAGHQFLA